MTKFQKIELIDNDNDDVIQIDKSRIVKVKPFEIESKNNGFYVAGARGSGVLEGSIRLSDGFDYVLTKDSRGYICLVVLEKDEKI